MAGDRQHHIPASLLGGFGRPAPDGRLRHATVAVRWKSSGVVSPGVAKAESVGYTRGGYRLRNPPPGVDPDVVDKLWDPIEPQLPGVVERLTNRQLAQGDDEILFAYVATGAVRHPTFELVAADWQKRHDLPAPSGDDVQVMRVTALSNQLPIVPTWRWRVLHSPLGNRRFMVSDRGWMLIADPSGAVLLPMGSRVAILGYPDAPDLPPRRAAFEEHFALCDSWIEWFNAATWADPYIGSLVAHPDDRAQLERLPDPNLLRVNGYGPFLSRRSKGLFD
jgi:hypothetical protein